MHALHITKKISSNERKLEFSGLWNTFLTMLLTAMLQLKCFWEGKNLLCAQLHFVIVHEKQRR